MMLAGVTDRLDDQRRAFAARNGNNATAINPGPDVCGPAEAADDVLNDIFPNRCHVFCSESSMIAPSSISRASRTV